MAETQNIQLSEKQRELVETLGVMQEQSGMSPAAARVSSLLLVSDVTELTFDEIREILNLSKSATSNALSFLQSLGRVEYITKSGERKRYFRANIGHWKDSFVQEIKGLTKLESILKKILKERSGEAVEFNAKLAELIRFVDFLSVELNGSLEKWESKN